MLVGDEGRTVVKLHEEHVDLGDVRVELERFEARYDVPSARLADAFRDRSGHLEETEDYRRWSQLWAIWRYASGS